MNEKQLKYIIRKCKNGDKSSFKELMLHFSDYVFAIAFRLLSNEDAAKDVVQETFIKVWQNIYKYKQEIKFTTWVYKICTNLCYDKLRMAKRKPLVFDTDFELIYRNVKGDGYDVLMENKELAIIITKLAEGLTPKQKLVFVLNDIQGLAADEIEELTELNKGQIKSNLYYARKSIRNKLIGLGYEVQ